MAMARDPDPVATVRLEAMGFQSLQQEFLVAGSSMLTVDFVDKDHLLVTFCLRRLMKRVVDAPPGDDDRMIGAYLVELPKGRVLARTEWRVHDRTQYLWSLGQGRFLLRVRDDLSVIAPMGGARLEDAFVEHPFLHMGRRIEAALVSADGELLTVETTKPGVVWDPEEKNAEPVQINFYRLKGLDGGGMQATSAGVIRTRSAVALPLTTTGILDVLEGGRDTWMFNFDEHTGKVRELAAFDTTCVPHVTFVGKGEFVAFGCRGSADKQDIAGFNLKGEAMWQQNFFDTHLFPTFAFAPEAGRFALGRTVLDGAVTSDNLMNEVNSQEVRVYQSYSGRMLLRVGCSPVERAGQNFAISPDGLELAAVQEAMVHHAATQDDAAYTDKQTAVQVYALPELTEKDRAAVKAAEAMAPEDTGARIDDALLRFATGSGSGPRSGDAGGGSTADASGLTAVPAAAAAPEAPVAEEQSAAAVAGAAGEGGSVGEGDAVPDAPRKAPTLYGPGEGPK
jgi:hypothetical protein